MPTRRVVARVELADIRRGLREAEKLVEECASKGGTSYVEKVSPTAVEVGCVYEAPEEAVVEKVGGAKYEFRSFELTMPEDPKNLSLAKDALGRFERFVEDCRRRGGEVSLTKAAKGVSVTCATRV